MWGGLEVGLPHTPEIPPEYVLPDLESHFIHSYCSMLVRNTETIKLSDYGEKVPKNAKNTPVKSSNFTPFSLASFGITPLLCVSPP